jgi:DNA-binding response OmpR family regulator
LISGGRVLVIEGYDSARESLGELLRGEGYEVYEASEIDSALSLLSQLCFDAILMAFNLPGPARRTLLEHVRKMTFPTAVFVMAEPYWQDEVREAIRLGARDCVTKPIVFSEVLDKMGALMIKPTKDRWRKT